MKMAIKRENDDFFVLTLNHESGLKGMHIPCKSKTMGTNSWNGHKTPKRQVFGHALKYVSGLTGDANPRGTSKLREIAHEHVRKMRKRQLFGLNS